MMNDPMVEEMAVRPPGRWAEIVRKAGVLKRYAAIARPTVDDMRRCAEELGCGQRQAYYYVRAWRARASGLPDPRSGPTEPSGKVPRPPSTEHAESLAPRLPDDGDIVSNETIRRERQHDERKPCPHPSVTMIVDCAPLAFDVVEDGTAAPARLLALLNVSDGRILAHALLSREATSDDALEILSETNGGENGVVTWTNGIGDALAFAEGAALSGVTPVPPGASSTPAGKALLGLIGPTVGRVRIMPRRRTAGPPGSAVAIDLARKALARIVAAHNLLLSDVAVSS